MYYLYDKVYSILRAEYSESILISLLKPLLKILNFQIGNHLIDTLIKVSEEIDATDPEPTTEKRPKGVALIDILIQ